MKSKIFGLVITKIIGVVLLVTVVMQVAVDSGFLLSVDFGCSVGEVGVVCARFSAKMFDYYRTLQG